MKKEKNRSQDCGFTLLYYLVGDFVIEYLSAPLPSLREPFSNYVATLHLLIKKVTNATPQH